ncbi:lipid-A-disaccharide synthase-related protein [Synechocystis sp. LKSZ1]|uniref:lipid-A-disaccharide synthase-related protein n=1 Tax=Synechocystis sp. LKSZ1 TaxID=3144951 RepID=UPI00336C032B
MAKLLVLSNGHGEDVIAVKVIEALQSLSPHSLIQALPLVGTGHTYQSKDISLIGPAQTLPSGGFIYMDSWQLWRDLQAGLIPLTLAQWHTIRQWRRSGGQILAVGDLIPLLLAWLSGVDYAFIGTAKSEYYLQDGQGWLPSTKFWECWLGADYYPWEIGLMKSPRCRAVFPRDSLTHQCLQARGVRSYDLGNPMMDGLAVNTDGLAASPGPGLCILLLPGSRSPEAERNWQCLLQALEGIFTLFVGQPIQVLAALAPALDPASFLQALIVHQWQEIKPQIFQRHQAFLHLSQNDYAAYLHQAQVALAMAGTATEQFVGLGKPVVSIVGTGPQFNRQFALRQTRLLGESVTLVEEPPQVALTLAQLLKDTAKLERIAHNGPRRLGPPGAADRIAQTLQQLWSTSPER